MCYAFAVVGDGEPSFAVGFSFPCAVGNGDGVFVVHGGGLVGGVFVLFRCMGGWVVLSMVWVWLLVRLTVRLVWSKVLRCGFCVWPEWAGFLCGADWVGVSVWFTVSLSRSLL